MKRISVFSKVLAVLMLLFSTHSFAQDLKGAMSQELKSAIQLTQSEQFDAAHKAFDALIASQPANGDNYYYYGECWLKQFFVDSMSVSLKEVTEPALKNYTAGMEKDPTNPLNYIGAAKVYILLGKIADAEEKFKKAKELMPMEGMNYKKSLIPVSKQALAYAKIAEAKLKSNNKSKEELLALIDHAVERDATVTEVYLIKGDIYLEYNDGSNAIVAYNKANDLDPNSCKAMVKIGQLWYRAKSYNDALVYYKDALKIDSTFAPAYRERAELYGLANQWENAIKDYKKFIDLSGNNVYAKVRYAQFLFMAKKYDDAISTINDIPAADAADPSYNILNRVMAYSCYELGKYPEGLKAIEMFMKNVKPEKILVSDYNYWGDLLVKNNNDLLAIEKYQKTYEMTPTCELLSKIVKCYQKLKDNENTMKFFLKKKENNCLSLNDTYEMAKIHYNMGNAAINAKDTAKAFENWIKADTLFGTVLKEKPDMYNVINYRAKMNISLDTAYKLGTAVKWYEVLIPLALKDTVKFAKDIYTAYDYIRFYYYKQYLVNKKCEDAKKSIEYCDKILAIDPKDEKAVETKKGLKLKCPN